MAAFPGVHFGAEIKDGDELWDRLSSRATGEPWYNKGESAQDISTRCKAFLDFLKARYVLFWGSFRKVEARGWICLPCRRTGDASRNSVSRKYCPTVAEVVELVSNSSQLGAFMVTGLDRLIWGATQTNTTCKPSSPQECAAH